MRDIYWILKLLLAATLVLVAIYFITPSTTAENTTTINVSSLNLTELTQSFVIVGQPVYPYHTPYRIEQGQGVYVNDTIDISGQGWGTGLAWYGRYQQYSLPQYIYTFTPYKHDVQNFYLDPDIFAGKPGMWYQYYGNGTERNGNLEAFKVYAEYRNTTWTFPNGTVIVTSLAVINETVEKPLPKKSVLPEVVVSDYLVAHGDPLPANFTKVWVFGTASSIYDSGGNITAAQVLSLEDGSYKLVSHEAGNNTIIEVGYNPSTSTLTSPWKNVQDVSVYGSQPLLDIDKFYQMIHGTDDRIHTYNLEVEEPAVTIVSIDEVDVGNRIPIAYEPGMTLLDVRGYSNVQNETEISLVMDPEIQTAHTLLKNTYTTKAIKSSPGNKSMYQIYIPINKNQMPNGIHTILVSTAIGGNMKHNFPISELPANSYVPNATLKYIGDENPWKPNLTIPEPVVIVNTVTVIQTVEIPVTPSQESLDAAQTKALMDTADYYTRMGVSTAGIVAIIYFVGRFFYRVYQKRRWYRK